MKKLAYTLVLSTLTSFCYAQPPAAPAAVAQTPAPMAQAAVPSSTGTDFSGTYKCDGYDPYNKNNYSYSHATFTKNDNVYNVQWQDDNGNPVMLGTGIMNSNVPDAIAILYSSPKKDYYILGLYKKNADGTLQSTWVSGGSKLIGTETCKKI